MSKPNLVPITRVNKFFSAEDFELEQQFSREFIESDGNFTVILYRVNRETTSIDDLYGEAGKDEIRFYPPVELKVMPFLAESENKAYNKNGTARYLQDGQLSFIIYDSQLNELGVDVGFGDYVGYPVTETDLRFFSVVNDGKKNYNNKNTIFGYKSAYRNILCASIDESEFRSV